MARVLCLKTATSNSQSLPSVPPDSNKMRAHILRGSDRGAWSQNPPSDCNIATTDTSGATKNWSMLQSTLVVERPFSDLLDFQRFWPQGRKWSASQSPLRLYIHVSTCFPTTTSFRVFAARKGRQEYQDFANFTINTTPS